MPLAIVKEKNTCPMCVDSILEDAVYLPCFKTICSSHIHDWKQNEHDTYVDCLLCPERHRIVDCERRNNLANEVIKADGHLSDLEIGLKKFSLKNNDDLRLNCEAYKNSSDYLNELNENHFDRLLIEIDAKREELKVEIDNMAEEFKREIIESKRRYIQLLNEITNEGLIENVDPTNQRNNLKSELRKTEIDFEELDRLNHLSINKTIQLKKKLAELRIAEHHIKNNFFEKNNDKSIRRNFFGTLRTDVVDRAGVTRETPNIERPIFMSYSRIISERAPVTASINTRSTPTSQRNVNFSSRVSQINIDIQQSARVGLNS